MLFSHFNAFIMSYDITICTKCILYANLNLTVSFLSVTNKKHLEGSTIFELYTIMTCLCLKVSWLWRFLLINKKSLLFSCFCFEIYVVPVHELRLNTGPPRVKGQESVFEWFTFFHYRPWKYIIQRLFYPLYNCVFKTEYNDRIYTSVYVKFWDSSIFTYNVCYINGLNPFDKMVTILLSIKYSVSMISWFIDIGCSVVCMSV